jgi:ankyrin repeat protein
MIDKAGMTALMWAASLGLADIVGQLIQGKASIELKDTRGRSALQIAEAQQNEDVVSLLSASGPTLLEVAKRGSLKDVMRALARVKDTELRGRWHDCSDAGSETEF